MRKEVGAGGRFDIFLDSAQMSPCLKHKSCSCAAGFSIQTAVFGGVYAAPMRKNYRDKNF